MKLNTSRIFLVMAVSLLIISACARETSNDQDSSSSLDDNGSAEERGGDEHVNLDYLLLVEFSMSSGDIVKEQTTVLFRGPLSLNSDGTASVSGNGNLEGSFRCANKDRKSDIKFLGPGKFNGNFAFNVKGTVLSEEEYYATTGEIPLVPLTEDSEESSYVQLFFPDGYGPPEVNMEGLNLSECFSADNKPISPQWTVGLSGLMKGDGGGDFNQYVYMQVEPGVSRQLDTLNPELIHAAFICLVEPGEICDLDI